MTFRRQRWAGEDLNLPQNDVDDIVTSAPDLGIRTRDEWIEMDATERAIVAARVLLGLRN